jgi:aprataxin
MSVVAGSEHQHLPSLLTSVPTVNELMAPKPKIPKSSRTSTSSATIPESAENIPKSRASGLLRYIQDPTPFPPFTVISHSSDFVTIRDLYPKSSVHLLVLPRSREKTHLHPFVALDGSDPAFLSSVRAECSQAKQLAASELRRLFGKYSIQDQAREEAVAADPPPDELPKGRDWEAEIMVGVHAVPSMSNLHIHVISVDRHSEKLKHRKHYNSFSTGFFVPLEDFPMEADDVRRCPGREGYLREDFRCWRCGRGFGGEFAKLKRHLDEEFEEWKRE